MGKARIMPTFAFFFVFFFPPLHVHMPRCPHLTNKAGTGTEKPSSFLLLQQPTGKESLVHPGSGLFLAAPSQGYHGLSHPSIYHCKRAPREVFSICCTNQTNVAFERHLLFRCIWMGPGHSFPSQHKPVRLSHWFKKKRFGTLLPRVTLSASYMGRFHGRFLSSSSSSRDQFN